MFRASRPEYSHFDMHNSYATIIVKALPRRPDVPYSYGLASVEKPPGRMRMLRIPSLRRLGDLTVYQDDAIWTRFYLIPSLPTIRRDKNGRPIFLLTIFHTSDQAREATAGTPRGGGFMNFDVQFAV